MVRGQYSLEFILTYAWAFLIIGIAIGAIYSLGLFNFENTLPEKCEFYGQMYCDDFRAVIDNGQSGDLQDVVDLVLINRFGNDLRIRDVVLRDPANNDICDIDFTDDPTDIYPDADVIATLDGNNDLRWRNGQEIQLQLVNCDQAQGGAQDTRNWYSDSRFEGTLNVTFYNPLTADPVNPGETAVLHNQLGDIYVYIQTP